MDVLAEDRPAILFDNAGIGRSTGTTPDTVVGIARGAIAFADALRLHEVDFLGFSLGGMVAQQLALDRPRFAEWSSPAPDPKAKRT